MKTAVLKFGGSSLATIDQVKKRAHQIKTYRDRGFRVIAVVSAMGKTTNELVDLAYKASPRPQRRELDMLLTTGERVSMALVSMVLNDLGCPAISFTGSQAGIFTASDHNDARILELRPHRVEEELSRGKVVVVAGFQGVDPKSKEITTLGRGGSDTTAIALAKHFTAAECVMFKEVAGVCNADPHRFPQAQTLPQITQADLYNLCFYGAKVIHFRAAEYARDEQVEFSIAHADQPEQFTRVVVKYNRQPPTPLGVLVLDRFLSLRGLPSESEFVSSINNHGLVLPNFVFDKERRRMLAWAEPEVLSPIRELFKNSLEPQPPDSQLICVVASTTNSKSQIETLRKELLSFQGEAIDLLDSSQTYHLLGSSQLTGDMARSFLTQSI